MKETPENLAIQSGGQLNTEQDETGRVRPIRPRTKPPSHSKLVTSRSDLAIAARLVSISHGVRSAGDSTLLHEDVQFRFLMPT